MNKEWTLHIENFAKIELADIRITPLMCFVGDNNSGKSYLMSLLWGILTMGKEIFPKVPSDTKVYKRCESWLKDYKNRNVEITEDIVRNAPIRRPPAVIRIRCFPVWRAMGSW